MLSVILFVIVFVLAVFINSKTKANLGILCMLGAFILAGWYAGTNPNDILGYFPTSVISTLVFTTVFFGYLNQTKMFTGLVDRILWATRGKATLFPFAIFLSCFVICVVGGNDSCPVIMSPIAFSLAAATGMNPLLAVLSSYLGSSAVGMAPWTPGGIMFSSLMTPGAGDQSMTAVWIAVVVMLIGSLVLLTIYYFILGGHKLKGGENFEMTKPQPFTRDQKIALATLCVVLILIFVPGVLKNYVSGGLLDVCNWLSTHVAVRQACLLGILFMALMRIGDGSKVIREMIPWGVFCDIAGAVMLIQCAADMGVIDFISGWISDSVPSFFVPALCVLIAGLLSFVSNAMGILPLFSPIMAEVAAATGHSPVVLCACLLIGCVATGLSPVSMGGSLHSMGANKEQREAIFGKQFFAAFMHLAIYIVFALIGFIPLIGKLFGV